MAPVLVFRLARRAFEPPMLRTLRPRREERKTARIARRNAMNTGEFRYALDRPPHALPRSPERQSLRPSGLGLRRDLRAHRRGSRIRARHVRRLGRLADGARRARPDRADPERVRAAGLPHQPRRQAAADGRCRPRLRQCAQCEAHGRGAGDRGRRRHEHRGHRAADAVRHDQAAPHDHRRGRRQDEGRARRPAGPAARDRRPHQRDPDHRPRRRHRARQGLRGGRRRRAVLRRHQDPRRARRDLGRARPCRSSWAA